MSDPRSAGKDTRGLTSRGLTSAQLKADIDGGRTGDKVGGFDPGAAPLGTDDEAGGDPLSPEAIALDCATEGGCARNSARANGATPELPPDGRLPRQRGLALVALAGAVAGGALGLLILAAL
jgi:hypothetical protein